MCKVGFLEKLCISDLSGLLMNEAKQIAEKFGMKYEYKKLINAKEIDMEILSKCVEKIFSEASPKEIANIIKNTKPYNGVVEFLHGIKSKGYKTYVITDNPLASLGEVKKVLKEKFPLEEIYSTSKINEETFEIESYSPKPEIFRSIYFNYKTPPEKILGVLQGKNDISLAYEIKKYGGILIITNSNSKELKEIADYNFKNTSYLPKILDKL